MEWEKLIGKKITDVSVFDNKSVAFVLDDFEVIQVDSEEHMIHYNMLKLNEDQRNLMTLISSQPFVVLMNKGLVIFEQMIRRLPDRIYFEYEEYEKLSGTEKTEKAGKIRFILEVLKEDESNRWKELLFYIEDLSVPEFEEFEKEVHEAINKLNK